MRRGTSKGFRAADHVASGQDKLRIHMDRSRELNLLLLPGYSVDDIPRLAMLADARDLMSAFTGVFRGADEDVILRLFVLLTMADRSEGAEWTPGALQAALGFVEEFKINTTLSRLSECRLISYEATPGIYRLTASAFLVLACWTSVMRFADARFGEFAFLNAQIAGGAETLGVSEEILNLALARTRDIYAEISQALTTGSTVAVETARGRMADAFQWAAHGVELLDRIAPDPNISDARRNAARRLASVQSRMLGLAPSLDQALHAMESQRVHLGASGLSSADIQSWLRERSPEELLSLLALQAAIPRALSFVASDLSLDVAEATLRAQEVDDVPLPPPAPPATMEFEPPAVDTARLDLFVSQLAGLESDQSLAQLVEGRSFDEASYRLSLLPLIGERGALGETDPAARLAELALAVEIGDALSEVSTGELARISAGVVRPLGGRSG